MSNKGLSWCQGVVPGTVEAPTARGSAGWKPADDTLARERTFQISRKHLCEVPPREREGKGRTHSSEGYSPKCLRWLFFCGEISGNFSLSNNLLFELDTMNRHPFLLAWEKCILSWRKYACNIVFLQPHSSSWLKRPPGQMRRWRPRGGRRAGQTDSWGRVAGWALDLHEAGNPVRPQRALWTSPERPSTWKGRRD